MQLNSHAARFDFNLTRRQQLFGRANVIYDKTVQAPNFPDTPSPGVWSHPTGLAVGHNWTLNNNMVNHFVYGFTREAFTQQGDSNANNISFRFVFSPLLFTRDVIRITPVHNFVDNCEVTRSRVRLYSQPNVGKTDTRHEIELQFRLTCKSRRARWLFVI